MQVESFRDPNFSCSCIRHTASMGRLYAKTEKRVPEVTVDPPIAKLLSHAYNQWVIHAVILSMPVLLTIM